jgi:hypothetical protein
LEEQEIEMVQSFVLKKSMKISVNVQKIKNYLNGPSLAWVNIYPQFWALRETGY